MIIFPKNCVGLKFYHLIYKLEFKILNYKLSFAHVEKKYSGFATA